MIELQLLGGVELRAADGAAIHPVLQQPKRLALLAYLAAAQPPCFARRDVLLALFWPELDEAAARNALGQAVHFLRQQLGEGALVSRGRTELAVDGAALRCDAAAFEAALEGGREAAALEVYRGDFLAGFHLSAVPDFERWMERERARLRTRAIQAAWTLAEESAGREEVDQAVRWSRAAHRLDPLDEPGLRRLLLRLDRAGDRAGALQAYEEFARTLREELQADPSPETRALAAGIRAQRAAPAAGPAPAASLAVLPFLDLSPEPEEYFSDGLTEELISTLAAVPGLRVTSRTSCFAYKGRSLPVRRVAEELGVTAVLEGSVRSGGGKVRVVAQLVDAESDAPLWSGSYDRELTDFLTVQGEVAEQIAHALQVELSADARVRIGARPPENPRAYHLYLRGRYFAGQTSPQSWHQAVEAFRLALQEDPRYALAYAGLASAYVQLPLFHFDPPLPRPEALARARMAAQRALELNDELGEAYVALGVVKWYEWEWEGAERAFRRALMLTPGAAGAHHRWGLTLCFLGRYDEAARELQRAQELDPLSLSIAVDRGVVDLRAGRTELAIARFAKVLEVDPGFHAAHHYLGEAHAYAGRYDLSVTHFIARGILTSAEGRELLALLPVSLLDYRRALLRRLERVEAAPTLLASGLVRAGETEKAWEALERAFQERDPVLADGVRVHPGLEPFRDDPRFADLLRRMGIEGGE